jgi:hypothetical protein
MVRRQVRRRKRRRRLRIALLSVAATTVVVAAAYGIDRLVVVAQRFYDEHHHAAPRATGASHPTTSTTATTIPGPVRCDSRELSAVVSDWRETGSTVEEIVTITNISVTACTVAGFPVLGVGAQDGTALPATSVDIGAPSGSRGAATTIPPSQVITLAHAARASFEVSYANVCDHVLQPGEAATGTPDECYAGVWLEVTPTAGSSPLIVTQPIHLTYATSGFFVGPFQVGTGSPLSGQPPPTATTTSPTTTSTTGP